MNKRRELILQRLSRIDSIQTAQSNPRATKFRGRPEGALSIEAAIGTYMTGTPNAVDMYMKQDVYTKSRSGQKKQMSQQMSRQMAEYMAVAEESQLANARSELSDNAAMDEEALQKILEADPSAKYQLTKYGRKAQPENLTVYDRLDADRCEGFLLYSYNKRGVHSVLGEHITPGSYGGLITSGEFISKA